MGPRVLSTGSHAYIIHADRVRRTAKFRAPESPLRSTQLFLRKSATNCLHASEPRRRLHFLVAVCICWACNTILEPSFACPRMARSNATPSFLKVRRSPCSISSTTRLDCGRIVWPIPFEFVPLPPLPAAKELLAKHSENRSTTRLLQGYETNSLNHTHSPDYFFVSINGAHESIPRHTRSPRLKSNRPTASHAEIVR